MANPNRIPSHIRHRILRKRSPFKHPFRKVVHITINIVHNTNDRIVRLKIAKESSALKYILPMVLQIKLPLGIQRQCLNKCPILDMTPLLICRGDPI